MLNVESSNETDQTVRSCCCVHPPLLPPLIACTLNNERELNKPFVPSLFVCLVGNLPFNFLLSVWRGRVNEFLSSLLCLSLFRPGTHTLSLSLVSALLLSSKRTFLVPFDPSTLSLASDPNTEKLVSRK